MRCFLLLLLLWLTGCNGFFYHPSTQVYFKPDQYELNYQSIWIHKNIHAWWIPHQGLINKGTVIQCHGNAQNLTSHFAFLAWLPQHGYNLLAFDYPGYGRSPGIPNPTQIHQTTQEVLRYVSELPTSQKGKKSILFAQSLGGAICLSALADSQVKEQFDGMVLESTFSSYRAMAKTKITQHWFTWWLLPFAFLVDDTYAPIKRLQKLPHIPYLVVHSDDDYVVPSRMGKQLFDMLPTPKQHWQLTRGGHTSSNHVEQGKYRQRYLEFFASL